MLQVFLTPIWLARRRTASPRVMPRSVMVRTRRSIISVSCSRTVRRAAAGVISSMQMGNGQLRQFPWARHPLGLAGLGVLFVFSSILPPFLLGEPLGLWPALGFFPQLHLFHPQAGPVQVSQPSRNSTRALQSGHLSRP